MDAYVQYLENVLGLRNLVWPEAEAAPIEEIPEDTSERIHVLFVAEKPFSPKAQELFEKMREAMKIPNEQYKVVFANEVSAAELQVSALAAEHVVCFSKTVFDQIPDDHPAKFLTHSPEILLTKAALKKEAWEDLKKVMKSLGVL